MSIRRGLRFGDQQDQPINPQEYGSTGFNADRNRSNFEKDVDSLLFGDSRPPPRRKRGQQPPKPAQPQKKPVPPAQVKKPVVVEPKKPEPVAPPAPKPVQKPKPKPQPPKQPEKKVDNFVQEKPTPPPVRKQTIEEQPRNTKQKDIQQSVYVVDNNLFYNRPGYIRKLKKVAEDFNFAQENTTKFRCIDVVRPSQILRNNVKKLNSPDFVDTQFPPNWTSVGIEAKSDSSIQWKRPQQVFKTPVLGKYVDPNDIQPGTMSSPQFLSTLSCLAEREENIKRLIENQKINSNGFYFVRINVNGVWRYIAVDHFLPESNGKALGARSNVDSESQLWISLIEKAYAKVYNGYSTFKSNVVPRQHYLRDLTGAPVRKYDTNEPDLSQIINEAIGFGFPVIAVPSQKIVEAGFNPNYSLSVVRASGKGIQFRSSWGTIVERPKVNISREGVFELQSSQLKDYISHFLIAETQPSLSSTTIQSKHCQSFYSCYSFKLSNPNPNATVSVAQWDRRLFSASQSRYDYVPFRIIIEKKGVEDAENNSLYVNAGFSHKARNLDLAVNLTPGVYYVYCIGSWGSQGYYDYDLTIHANELVQLSKIYHQNFPNIIAQALTQQCLYNGKRSAKGNVDQYIIYHEPSNLVLLTALSLVDRSYTHTLNLQQVKPQSLSLLNVIRPEDNFAKKLRNETKDYKDGVFGQKTWQITLLPHQKYTWVFSSDTDYDQNNFKNWGFR